MNKIKNFAKKLWKDESAQGATEYILLLVVVVAVVMLFRKQIFSALQGKLDQLGGDISGFSGGE
jgi:Flp pilus assembly pilin Flp